ncbi:MAG: hypothetical protein KBS74_01510 [Clostridiales bacterium]|nr:hypothetical protein [Candidatus Cacconaster stercorequi]
MASKYAPLTEWLQTCGQDTVRLTYTELEGIIPIPPSAYKDRPSWANCKSSGSPFQKGWLNAGYIVSAIDMKAGWVEFTKGEPQQRGTRTTAITYKQHLDEEALTAAIQKGYDCYNDMQSDPNHRYRSWGHCHKAFKQHREDPDSIDTDTLCLHLAWYLASWGMLRNSFLMQKDYRIHADVVDLLFEPEWDDLWDATAQQLANKETAQKIMQLCTRITEAYLASGSGGTPTNTLLTKILLGTVGCAPAYDRYFKQAISRIGAAPQQFSASSLTALGAMYIEHNAAFEALREHCSKAGFAYPAAKIIDMCFFEYGLTIKDNAQESTDEE